MKPKPVRLIWHTQCYPYLSNQQDIELTFKNDPMFCFRYGLGDGEFRASFRESLTLSLVVAAHSFFFLTSQYKKSIP